jgi:phosphoribosylamine--glycine ligase
MGAVSPCPHLAAHDLDRIESEVLLPTVHTLSREKREYRGVLYAGLMMTRAAPRLLEYNVRFGDPEAQVLLPRLTCDLLELLLLAAEGRLEELPDSALTWDPRAAVTVVLTAQGYPDESRRGDPISGIEDAEAMRDVFVFHAGTTAVGGRAVTAGGRILGVTALGRDIEAARTRAYAAVDKIRFAGMRCRRDIASP